MINEYSFLNVKKEKLISWILYFRFYLTRILTQNMVDIHFIMWIGQMLDIKLMRFKYEAVLVLNWTE